MSVRPGLVFHEAVPEGLVCCLAHFKNTEAHGRDQDALRKETRPHRFEARWREAKRVPVEERRNREDERGWIELLEHGFHTVPRILTERFA